MDAMDGSGGNPDAYAMHKHLLMLHSVEFGFMWLCYILRMRYSEMINALDSQGSNPG